VNGAASSLLSSAGTLGRGRFAVLVVIVYAVGLASQALLTGPVLLRVGLWPFIVLHAALLWVWYAVHARRLRDAGRDVGPAIGIAIVNVLSVTFLVMVMLLLVTPVEGQPGETVGGVLATWIVFMFMLQVLSGNVQLGWFGILLDVLLFIALVPISLAVGFSLWAGTRGSVQAVRQ
jgi:uncharacterized membrane protein YhaH (DUF805 family)